MSETEPTPPAGTGPPVRITDETFVQTLEAIHQPEMFQDCVEDGDPWPCRTIRLLRMWQGDA